MQQTISDETKRRLALNLVIAPPNFNRRRSLFRSLLRVLTATLYQI